MKKKIKSKSTMKEEKSAFMDNVPKLVFRHPFFTCKTELFSMDDQLVMVSFADCYAQVDGFRA
jgi:hypothetical protein